MLLVYKEALVLIVIYTRNIRILKSLSSSRITLKPRRFVISFYWLESI